MAAAVRARGVRNDIAADLHRPGAGSIHRNVHAAAGRIGSYILALENHIVGDMADILIKAIDRAILAQLVYEKLITVPGKQIVGDISAVSSLKPVIRRIGDDISYCRDRAVGVLKVDRVAENTRRRSARRILVPAIMVEQVFREHDMRNIARNKSGRASTNV